MTELTALNVTPPQEGKKFAALGEGTLASGLAVLRVSLGEIATLADSGTRRRAQKLRKMIDNYSRSVTLVGQVKAGKTALTNALADKPGLLPSDVNPWTSVVTTLHVNKPPLDGQRAVFDFFDHDEWQKLMQGGGRLGELARRAQHSDELDRLRRQLETMRANSQRRLGHKFELLMGNQHRFAEFNSDLINRYVCMGDDESAQKDGQYADVTKSAQLYVQSPSYTVPISLRDTPGVNDPFLVREQVTLSSLADTDICVIVLSAHQAMTSVDMGLLRIILALQSEQIIVFVNRVDELDAPYQQIPEIERAIRATLKSKSLPEDLPIVFGSALWAEHAQAGRLNELPPASLAALRNLAQPADDASAQALALSGIPALRHNIELQSGRANGRIFLDRMTKRVQNLAQQARALLRHSSNNSGNPGSITGPEALEQHLEALSRKHLLANEKHVNSAVNSLHLHMDDVVEEFITLQATALAKALDSSAGINRWTIDSNLVRHALKLGYDAFAQSCATAIARVSAAAADDILTLYGQLTDNGGIIIEPPGQADIPAPVMLGRTLSIDLGHGWWSRWFSAARQPDAIIKDMRSAMKHEIAPLLREIELDQAALILTSAQNTMTSFIDEHAETLRNLLARSKEANDTGADDGDVDETIAPGQSALDRISAIIKRLSMRSEAHPATDGGT